jgi:tetratricopeptide (TPR) repeat protein
MSKKIGRNDPCPCGSGKKYKKCCLKKDTLIQKYPHRKNSLHIGIYTLIRINMMFKNDPEKHMEMMKKHGFPVDKKRMEESIKKSWDIEKVREMHTEEIIAKLESMNVRFSPNLFKKQVEDYLSAIQLAERHYFTQNYYAEGWDEDFIWLAIVELWKRFMPEQINIEMIDDAMQEGYNYLENNRLKSCLERWETAWDMIKTLVPSSATAVGDADLFLPEPLTQSIHNWCQDFEMQLNNAGVDDKTYFKKRIGYCNEFCRIFPDSYAHLMVNMYRAEAESYAALGDFQTAEKLFKTLINHYPANIWGYVGWGDMYRYNKPHENEDENYNEAKRIYNIGLAKCSKSKEIDVIYDRLEISKKNKDNREEQSKEICTVC